MDATSSNAGGHSHHGQHDHATASATSVGPSTQTPHTGHMGHTEHAEHTGHGGGHDKHAGHDPEMFRRKFWLSLALTVPVVLTSDMVMDWFGYRLTFPGVTWIGPVLGTVVFAYGGWPFLVGGVRELRDR